MVVPHIPIPIRKGNKGRHRNDDRMILNGILWILRTGAPWKYLPKEYGSYQTCHRRFQEWVDHGVFAEILTALAKDMEERGKLNVSECFIDGTFSPAKKGGLKSGLPNAERAVKSWLLQTALVFHFPSSWPLLLRMKSDWWRKRLPRDLPARFRYYLSATGLTTPTSLIEFYDNIGSEWLPRTRATESSRKHRTAEN